MRGVLAVPIQVPLQGLVLNVPPHQVGPQALIGGSNVFIDIDGLLKPRKGISLVNPISPFVAGERVMNVTGYLDQSGVFYQLAVSTAHWSAYLSGNWTDITGGVTWGGSKDNPIHTAVFPQSGVTWVYGTDNNDVPVRWSVGQASIAQVPAFPVCRDIIVLANRMIAVNTVESGTRYQFRVRWSTINDATSWPALNFADLLSGETEPSDAITCIKPTSRTSAVIYRTQTAWAMQAYPGGDANAFTFERIPAADDMAGPVGPSAVVLAEGQHYYLGTDGRIYNYNGVTIQPISQAIDPLLRSQVSFPTLNRSHGIYVPFYRQVHFFIPTGSDQDPRTVVTYDLRLQAFMPLATYANAITASTELEVSTGVTWLTWVSATETWSDPAFPWASWDSITNSNQLANWVGGVNGQVYYYFNSANDAGSAIPYSANWAPIIFNNDPRKSLLLTWVELYMIQASIPEALEVDFNSAIQPFGTQTPLVSMAIALEDQTTYYMPTEPGPLNPRNMSATMLFMNLSSAGNLGQLQFGGGTLYLDGDDRGEYGVQ